MLEWIKKTFSNWGLAKDAMSDPVNTGGEVTESILIKLSPTVQRIVVLALIVVAMLLGADMGIDYQAQKQQSLMAVPLACPSSTVNP